MSNEIDNKIEQCKNDIQKLQDELTRLKEQKNKKYYRIGQNFELQQCLENSPYALCQVGKNEVELICLGLDHNRWRESVHVLYVNRITEDEMKKIYGVNLSELVEVKLDIRKVK